SLMDAISLFQSLRPSLYYPVPRQACASHWMRSEKRFSAPAQSAPPLEAEGRVGQGWSGNLASVKARFCATDETSGAVGPNRGKRAQRVGPLDGIQGGVSGTSSWARRVDRAWVIPRDSVRPRPDARCSLSCSFTSAKSTASRC